MLEELHVRNLALIEDVWLEFGPGMTAITGETGAGKTALLGALKLLLGERADSGAVRTGAPEAAVEGRFSVDGDELVASRKVTSEGRSRCVLDGEMATVGTLAARVGPLVDLHGQHDHQALLSPSTHVGYLDRWAGARVSAAVDEYRAALGDRRRAVSEHRALEERIATARRDADYLRFVADEIDNVDPVPGEDDALLARLPALQHAERLAEVANLAVASLRDDGGAFDRVAEASAALEKVLGIDVELDALAGRLGEVEAQIDDIGAALRKYRDGIDSDPVAIESVHSRLSQLSSVTKKYGPRLEDAIARRDEARKVLSAADEGEEALDGSLREVEQATDRLVVAGNELAGIRREVAPGFMDALAGATEDLAMQGASFEVSFRELPLEEWTGDGPHRVEFLYAPAAGRPARSLSRIASGGELSRVMLALKGVLGAADTIRTLVFDEIDAGIGGATALSVGARLAELAREHQVIVVTHLAQVAAFADTQLVVRKQSAGTNVATSVAGVDGESREAEIARMLSGDDSGTSRAHAVELISKAAAMRDRGTMQALKGA